MSEYQALAFFTSFITLYFIFMVPMGGAHHFAQDFDFSEDDLTITPDIETPDRQVYHLQDDALDSEGVTFYNLSEVDGEVGIFTDVDSYDINTVAGRANNTNTSYIVYDIQRWDEIDTLFTNRALNPTDIEVRFQDNNGNVQRTETGFGPRTFELADDESVLNVSFTGSTSDYFYYLEGISGQSFDGTVGFLNLIVRWTGSVVNYFLSLLQIAAALPFYLNIPFVIYIGYLIYKAVTLG